MDTVLYQKLKIEIHSTTGINLDSYKDEQMRRRLDAWLVRTGARSWEDYIIRLRTDKEENTRFRNYLTINVTEFFRDFDKWEQLKKNILPNLLHDSINLRGLGDGLRVWSAGCSIGAEPYSLTMILNDLAPNRRHFILATDLDRGALAKATAGGPYLLEEIKNVPEPYKKLYFHQNGDKAVIQENLIKKITFKEHNLLSDPYERDLDLIICRNVVIYFTTEAKDYIFRNFHQSLRTGGILFLGGTEIIPRPNELGFTSSGISFYKKL